MPGKGNPEGLRSAAEQKKNEALERTNKAISQMVKEGKKINFQTVAQEAGVSVAYLYKYEELKQRIDQLRKQQSPIKGLPPKQGASDDSRKAIVATLKERIRRVEAENRGLREHIEVIQGIAMQVTDLKQHIEVLKAENAELKKQLEECHSRQPGVPPTDNPKVTPIEKGKTRGITDRIKDELDRLGIKLNSTLTRIIKAADEQTVLDAIAALEKEIKTTEVGNPGGFLFRAIKERWVKSDPPQPLPQRQPEIYTASPETDEDLVPLDQLKQLFGGTDE